MLNPQRICRAGLWSKKRSGRCVQRRGGLGGRAASRTSWRATPPTTWTRRGTSSPGNGPKLVQFFFRIPIVFGRTFRICLSNFGAFFSNVYAPFLRFQFGGFCRLFLDYFSFSLILIIKSVQYRTVNYRSKIKSFFSHNFSY